MQYLNLLYFVIITYWGFSLLKTHSGVVKGVLDKTKLYRYSGPELFWCLTFATGLLAFSLTIGIDLMAVRLGVLEVLCIVGLNTVKNSPIISVPLKIYFLYLIWIFIGSFYGPSLGFSVRVILKYAYPLLLCLFASAAVRDEEVFLKSASFARIVALISIFFEIIPYVGILVPGVFWYSTAESINYISMMIFSLGMFYYTKKKNNLLYVVIFMIPCFRWVLRTSIMGSLVAIMAFYFIKFKVRSLPIIAGVLVAGIIAVFTIPSLRNKMFFDNNVTIEQFQAGKLDESSINTNAREGMWKHLEAKFYQDHELIGSGTGAVQQYMYTHNLFGGLKVPHSDFVQLRCDNGLMGLILYALIALGVCYSAFRTYWSTRIPILKLASIVAGASMIGVFVTLYSDNVVNYSMATLSMPFGFYGMMLGIKRHYNQ